MAIKTSSAKAKGRALQQRVRDLILATFPALTLDDVRSTSMGAGGEDVQLSAVARAAMMNFTIECKARAKIVIYEWFEQARGHKKFGAEPLLIVKGNNKPALAIVEAETFFALVRKANEWNMATAEPLSFHKEMIRVSLKGDTELKAA